jgi:Protein of unknown function (DUF3592)
MISTALVMGIIIIILGLAISIFGIKSLLAAKAALSWPIVAGQIVESTLIENTNSKTAQYIAKVTYQYAVNGVTQNAGRITFGDNDSRNFKKEIAAATVANYPSGKTVKVYYDLQNAANAVLVPGVSSNVHTLLRVGIVFLLVGIGFSYWAIIGQT